jgi:hypothetical protein
MVIELFGLPGAGKTLLAKELSAALSIPVINLTLLERLLFWGKALLFSPKTTLSGVWLLFRYGKDTRYSLFMNGCLDRYARFEKARGSGGILDEGPLQNVLSFPSRTLFPKEMDAFVVMLPHPDVLIRTSADKEVRKSRQIARGRVARSDAWEVFGEENEGLAVGSLPGTVTVLEFPLLSVAEIAQRIQSL